MLCPAHPFWVDNTYSFLFRRDIGGAGSCSDHKSNRWYRRHYRSPYVGHHKARAACILQECRTSSAYRAEGDDKIRADSQTAMSSFTWHWEERRRRNTQENIPNAFSWLQIIRSIRIVTCRAVAMQRPRDGRIYQDLFLATAFNMFPQHRTLAHQQICVFYVVRAQMLYARDKVRSSQFCTGVCEKRTWARRHTAIAIVRAVTRKRLVTDWEH
jgi:hypothetical protein